MKIGDAVEYVDQSKRSCTALLTAVHGPEDQENVTVNLVFVSHDPNRQDRYGRQTEHESSIVHESMQGAGGFFWRQKD